MACDHLGSHVETGVQLVAEAPLVTLLRLAVLVVIGVDTFAAPAGIGVAGSAAVILAVLVLSLINMYLQYKKIGKWKDYLYGERVYIILSLTAKTVLAWIIWSGTLAP